MIDSQQVFLQVRLNLHSLTNVFKRFFKNGKSDIKDSTTLQIVNLILYNFYSYAIPYLYS